VHAQSRIEHTIMKRLSAVALAALALAFALPTQAAEAPVVKDWDVYVDLPTRFAFVKTPLGWKFVRQLDEEQMTRLPRTTLTSLLPADDGGVRFAHPALEPSPRMLAQHAADRHFARAGLATAGE
jgi:hypothetical protein